MNIKDIPMEERPRERVLNNNIENISNEELLSIVLKTGTKNKSVKELAMEVLKTINGISNMKNLTINQLLKIKGIGITKAIEVVATVELGRRIYLSNRVIKTRLTTPEDVYKYMRYDLQDKKQEYFYCLYLNNKKELIERKLLFMGTINKSIVHPREIFKEAYLLSASSIICVHNHPSGDSNPSKEDIFLTKALVDIGKIQNIPVLDHVIVCDNEYYSFNDNNLI